VKRKFYGDGGSPIKQHITPKQALELSEEQFYLLFPDGIVKRKDWANYHHKKVTIGKMIEILDSEHLEINKVDGKFRVANNFPNGTAFYRVELVDALWEAVKIQSNSDFILVIFIYLHSN
jgi:hypothetical protein